MSHGYRFVPGRGRHYGVPARDLTQDEFEALEPAKRRIVRHSPAYEPAPEPARPAPRPRSRITQADTPPQDGDA